MNFKEYLNEEKEPKTEYFKKGDKLNISKHTSEKGKGLSYPDFNATALEDGAIGGWDVYDVENDKKEEVSVYGFSIEIKNKDK